MAGADELFDIVDEEGRVIGTAPRKKCHGDPSLIHRTVHVFVFHPGGGILLQKRRMDKDIQPGKWDTSVGGHLMHGETWNQAASRELAEELGWNGPADLEFLFDARIRNEIESENTRVYRMTASGPFDFQRSEIDEIRFWSEAELRETLKRGACELTPNLVLELKRILKTEVSQ